MALEVLDFALVLLGGFAGFEGAEVTAFAGLGIELAGVKTIFPGFEFANHLLMDPVSGGSAREMGFSVQSWAEVL